MELSSSASEACRAAGLQVFGVLPPHLCGSRSPCSGPSPVPLHAVRPGAGLNRACYCWPLYWLLCGAWSFPEAIPGIPRDLWAVSPKSTVSHTTVPSEYLACLPAAPTHPRQEGELEGELVEGPGLLSDLLCGVGKSLHLLSLPSRPVQIWIVELCGHYQFMRCLKEMQIIFILAPNPP